MKISTLFLGIIFLQSEWDASKENIFPRSNRSLRDTENIKMWFAANESNIELNHIFLIKYLSCILIQIYFILIKKFKKHKS